MNDTGQGGWARQIGWLAGIMMVFVSPCFGSTMGLFTAQREALQAKADIYANRILPQILTNWNIEVFSQNAHSSVWQTITYDELEGAFFAYRKLGELQRCSLATGEVVMSETLGGSRAVMGSYVAYASFQNGDAELTLITIRDADVWWCAALFVRSDVLYQQTAGPVVNESVLLRNLLGSKTDEERTQIEDELMAKDELAIRHRFVEVSTLAALREEQGNMIRASELYRTALRGSSSNLEIQMKLAEIQASLEKTNEALSRALTVFRLAETPSLFERARSLLVASDACPPPPEALPAGLATNIEFVLVPMGGVSTQLVLELRAELQRELGIRCEVWPGSLPLPEPGRSEADRYIEHVFSAVTQEITRLQFDDLRESVGIEKEAASLSHGQKMELVEAYIGMLGLQGASVRAQYEAATSFLSTQYQYRADAMIRVLEAQFPAADARVKGIIGITDADIYADAANFLFGTADSDYGVVSSFQFRAAKGFESESRLRLLKRLKKQALSTAGFIMGIPRCVDPSCARAFPISVAEHDAKSEQLCPDCSMLLEAYKRSPNSAFAAALHINRGAAFYMQGDYDGAVVQLRRAVQLCGTNANTWLDLGNSHRMRGDLAACEQVLLQAVEFNPGHDELLVALASACSAQGRTQEAIRVLDSVLSMYPSNYAAHVNRAQLADAAGDFSLCQRLLAEALKLCPTNPSAYCLLGAIQNNRGDYSGAIISATRALSLDTNNVGAVILLGMALSNVGRTGEALPYLSRAVLVCKNDADVWRQLGICYSSAGQREDAVLAFQKAASITPTNALFVSDLGYAYFLKGEHETAVECYNRALQMDPAFGLAHYNKALACHAMGNRAGALESLNRARDAGYPGSPQFRSVVEQKALQPAGLVDGPLKTNRRESGRP